MPFLFAYLGIALIVWIVATRRIYESMKYRPQNWSGGGGEASMVFGAGFMGFMAGYIWPLLLFVGIIYGITSIFGWIVTRGA